ncbi:2-isopropylmalate synthase, partial [Phytophthora palmivora]
MIETEIASAKTRGRPRTKKPSIFGDVEDVEDFSNMKKVKRRRGPQKRRDVADEEEEDRRAYNEMEQLPLGPNSLHLMQHLHEGQRYDREPRLLPEIDGVNSLTHHEAQVDIRSIQQQLAVFEARSGIQLPGGRPNIGDKDHRRLFLVDENDGEENVEQSMLKNRRSRP